MTIMKNISKKYFQENTLEAMFRDLQSDIMSCLDSTIMSLGGKSLASEITHQKAVLGLFFLFREKLRDMVKELDKATGMAPRHASAAKISRQTLKYIKSLNIASEFENQPPTKGQWEPSKIDNPLQGTTDTISFAQIITSYMECLHYILIDNLDKNQRKQLTTEFCNEFRS